MSAPSPEELLRREFSAAKLGWSLILLLQLTGLGLAVAASIGGASWSLLLGWLGLLTPLAVSGLRQWAQKRQVRGDSLRRSMLLQRSWDRPIARDSLLVGLADRTSVPSWDPAPLGSYYASGAKAGPRRFVNNLAESTFFTLRQAKVATRLCFFVSGVIGLFGLSLLWLLASGWQPPYQGSQLTQIPSALIAFAVGNEFLGAAFAYQSLHEVSKATLRDCAAISGKVTPPTPTELLLLLAAYDCSLAQSPPLPGILYRIQRRKLDRDWKAYGAQLSDSAQ